MIFVKIFLVLVTVSCTVQADAVSSIPFVGGVLGSITNASRNVINTAVDAVQYTSDQLMGRADLWGGIITKRIKEILKEFQGLMIDEIELLGLPRLEPFDMGHIDINITHEIGMYVVLKKIKLSSIIKKSNQLMHALQSKDRNLITDFNQLGYIHFRFEGTMDDVVVTKLSEFIVDNVHAEVKSKMPLKIMDPNITINLHYDELEISGKYDIKAYVGDLFNIWGVGPFNLTLRGLQIEANANVILELMNQVIRIDDVAIGIKLENMTCNFENLMGGGDTGELFNKIIGELAPEAVEVLWPEIRPGVEAKVKEVGNLKINEIGYDTLIGIILPPKTKTAP